MISGLLLGFFMPIYFQTFLCSRFCFRCIAIYTSFCFPTCYSWSSVDIVACAPVRAVLAACIGLNAFSTFTQDNKISLDVDELYSTIF